MVLGLRCFANCVAQTFDVGWGLGWEGSSGIRRRRRGPGG